MLKFSLGENRTVSFERSCIVGKPETFRMKIAFTEFINRNRKDVIWCELKAEEIERLREYLNSELSVY